MQIWKKLGLTVVLCVLSAGMTVNAGFTGSNVHSAGQSMGVGGLLEESMDPEACLEAAQNAKETRKKIYGYENLGVAKVNDYLNIRLKTGSWWVSFQKTAARTCFPKKMAGIRSNPVK